MNVQLNCADWQRKGNDMKEITITRRLTGEEVKVAANWTRMTEKKPKQGQRVRFMLINRAWPPSTKACGIFFKAAAINRDLIGFDLNLPDRFLTERQGTFIGEAQFVYWTPYRWWERLWEQLVAAERKG